GIVYQYSPAGADAWVSTPSAWDTTALDDGSYDVRAVATDNAGNDRVSHVFTVEVDNTSPSVTLTNPGAYVRGAVTLAVTASDDGSGVDTVSYQYSAAGADSWTTTPSSWDTKQLADGLYDVRAVVRDVAGNLATASAPGLLVDNTAPTAAMTDPGAQ